MPSPGLCRDQAHTVYRHTRRQKLTEKKINKITRFKIFERSKRRRPYRQGKKERKRTGSVRAERGIKNIV